jgi:hypothetical protein
MTYGENKQPYRLLILPTFTDDQSKGVTDAKGNDT